MISIRSSADMARALNSSLDEDIKWLLATRRDQLLTDTDLHNLAHFVIVQRGDALSEVEAEAGIPLAINLVDGSMLGEPNFTASFEFVERHGRWWEGVIILSDDGFGLVLLVPDEDGVDPALRALLREHV